jgi:hypothetical protein
LNLPVIAGAPSVQRERVQRKLHYDKWQVLGRTNRLLSSDTTWTAQKMARATILLFRIRGFHSGGYEEYHLLGYDAV